MNDYSDTLFKIYERLRKYPNDTALKGIHIPRSEVYYIRSLLQIRFNREFSLLETETLLREEGLLNNDEANGDDAEDDGDVGAEV